MSIRVYHLCAQLLLFCAIITIDLTLWSRHKAKIGVDFSLRCTCFFFSHFCTSVLFIFVIGFTVTFFVYNSREPQYAGDEEVTSKLMDAQILDVFQLGTCPS